MNALLLQFDSDVLYIFNANTQSLVTFIAIHEINTACNPIETTRRRTYRYRK